jgi:steroid 5-alpha reductase family enzyme
MRQLNNYEQYVPSMLVWMLYIELTTIWIVRIRMQYFTKLKNRGNPDPRKLRLSLGD